MIIVHKNASEYGVQWKATDNRPVALGQFFKHVQFISEFSLGGQERQRKQSMQADARVRGVVNRGWKGRDVLGE